MIPPQLVVDTNIVMSALITPPGRMDRTIMDVSAKSQLMACHYLYIELFHHKDKVLKISKLAEYELLELLLYFLNKLEFVNEQRISPENGLQHWSPILTRKTRLTWRWPCTSTHPSGQATGRWSTVCVPKTFRSC